MISVMLVSWTNTPDCLFPVHRLSHAEKTFDLLHLDLWTSPVISVSGSKYYLVILDDFTHYLWNFPLKQKSDTCTILSNFFLLMLLLSSAALSNLYNAITDVSLTTHPPRPSSYLKAPSCGCRAPTRPHKMVKPNVLFVPLTMSFARC
jgi:hypothetical protein